jgi:hypothetical protein
MQRRGRHKQCVYCGINSGLFSGNNADLEEVFLSVRYTHPPIDEQLAQHKVRSIELDAWPDPDGGRFKCNAIRRFFLLGNYVDKDPAMNKPGLKVCRLATPFRLLFQRPYATIRHKAFLMCQDLVAPSLCDS